MLRNSKRPKLENLKKGLKGTGCGSWTHNRSFFLRLTEIEKKKHTTLSPSTNLNERQGVIKKLSSKPVRKFHHSSVHRKTLKKSTEKIKLIAKKHSDENKNIDIDENLQALSTTFLEPEINEENELSRKFKINDISNQLSYNAEGGDAIDIPDKASTFLENKILFNGRDLEDRCDVREIIVQDSLYRCTAKDLYSVRLNMSNCIQPIPSGHPHDIFEDCLSQKPFAFCDMFKPYNIYSKHPKTSCSATQTDLLRFASSSSGGNGSVLQITSNSKLDLGIKTEHLSDYKPEKNFRVSISDCVFCVPHILFFTVVIHNCKDDLLNKDYVNTYFQSLLKKVLSNSMLLKFYWSIAKPVADKFLDC